ncbi:FtsX-like permease family protein [Corynebacterium breve]|uniref:FtsX-like permease family protein n=1 Tax=Corynebacterium breve TaxID=3049799 RepID=A0ABY8VI97_9CORY|nr:FtsX-like permease family protein [Corynebacterium breve]WIM67280.1 FtsX-like permease family protein [Corynebacterium breve]
MASTMRKVSLRNIAAHKLRLALTVLAVVLGTAFIAGSFMFTNSLSNTFDSAVNNAYKGVDVVVEPGQGNPGVPRDVVDQVIADPEVANVNIAGSTTVVVANEDREAFQTGGGASTVTTYYSGDAVVGKAVELVEGSAPAGPEEVIANKKAADKFDLSVGQRIIIVDPATQREATVVGLYDDDLDQGSSLNLRMAEPDYIEAFTDGIFLPSLSVAAAEGTEAEELVTHLSQAYPDMRVETGQKLADDASKSIEEALSFVNYFLIAFGLVGLLVGTFLIANTFSMIVAQRSKEFALLRALGAAKGQITRSVVGESIIVGLIGSALGVAAGVGLVAGIKMLLAAFGTPLPDSGLGLSTSAVAVPMVVGTLVTVISAWTPARRAGQVEPVEAMRSTESSSPQPLKKRTIFGIVLIAVGVALTAGAMFWEDGSTGNRASLIGVATVAVVIGVFLAGPALSLPLVPTFGALIGLPFRAVGRLAATNSKRNPRRTSATAFALTLGIALVTAIGMFGATTKASISSLVENDISADYVLSGPDSGGFPVPNDVPEAIRGTSGVDNVVFYAQAPVAVNGQFAYQAGPHSTTDVMSGDPSQLIALEVEEGTADLTGNTIIAPRGVADAQGWNVGDTVELSAPAVSTETLQLTVGGIFTESPVFPSYLVSYDAVQELVRPQMSSIMMVGVNNDGSVDDDTLRANLEAAVKDFIVVQVRSTEEMSGLASVAVDQMLSILYALLALAIVIAILGIVNTLTLSVIERRQEIGMLRAVGTQRRQIQTMIILESVQIAVFGTVIGMAIGLGLGWAFLTVLGDSGLETITIPWTLLVIMLIGSVAIGVLAALWPARRAAKTPPLDAIAD